MLGIQLDLLPTHMYSKHKLSMGWIFSDLRVLEKLSSSNIIYILQNLQALDRIISAPWSSLFHYPIPSKPDYILWSLSSNGLFSCSSFYSSISSPLSAPFNPHTIWFSLVPPKIQAFLLKIAWHRALTQSRFQSLHLNSVLSPHMYLLCSANSESNDHFFIHCPFSWSVWCKLFHLVNFNWAVPSNLLSLISPWRAFPSPKKPKRFRTFASMPYVGPSG